MADFDSDEPPEPPVPPVVAVLVDVGLGKTRSWCERVAVPLAKSHADAVLAVPRHRLGDEVVGDLAALGLTSRVYRGREADDPDAPGEKMCRDLARVGLITDALGNVTTCACKYKDSECEFFQICGYQKQREQRPNVWIVPHHLLFLKRPSFIPRPDSLAIDEAFWAAALHGDEQPYKLWLAAISGHREITGAGLWGSGCDYRATADLLAISRRVGKALEQEKSGRIRRGALTEATISAEDLDVAYRLERRRKFDVSARPGMPLAHVKKICIRIAAHNQLVARLAQFWDLLRRTVAAPDERSPWLELRLDEPLPNGEGTAPAVLMVWRDDIDSSWAAPTLIMDATMPTEIVRQFFPAMSPPQRISAPMPHAHVRQIVDRLMTAEMLIPTEGANERTNAPRRANVERIRRFLKVRAAAVSPGRVLVVCQFGLETALRAAGGLAPNVETRHFNDIAGENAWNEVALLVVIGRTEPSPRVVATAFTHLARFRVMQRSCC
jgi:hypothetical protein